MRGPDRTEHKIIFYSMSLTPKHKHFPHINQNNNLETTMVSSISALFFIFFALLFSARPSLTQQQPLLDSAEQESVFRVLDSINPTIPWRTLFPEDLCISAPHGVVCDYFSDPGSTEVSVHITELSFGYVSDFSPNPPCFPNSTLNPLIFTSFNYLRKLFFYKCFTEKAVAVVPEKIPPSFGSALEELVFIDNSALVGPLDAVLRNFTNLRRLVLSGNGFYGSIPDSVYELVNIEEITLSRNKLSGGLYGDFSKLKSLKIFDLSHNFLVGNVPDSVGNLTALLKLDLSSNGFTGKIPETVGKLENLEFLDLSFNKLGNFGVPLFLSQLSSLKELYLSGNLLGGQIPEIWENLRGISGIGFSGMGLVGKIPASIGLHLKNLCFLWLDNNKLEGQVPEQLGYLNLVSEINLENNKLGGRLPFSANFTAKVGAKLRLSGNTDLCVDMEQSSGPNIGGFRKVKACNKSEIPHPVLLSRGNLGTSSRSTVSLVLLVTLIVLV